MDSIVKQDTTLNMSPHAESRAQVPPVITLKGKLETAKEVKHPLPSPPHSPNSPHIIDLRGNTANSNTAANLQQSIITSLQSVATPFVDPKTGQSSLLRSIPTMVLYDDRGLEIFDQITYNEDYYLTGAEIDIFVRHAEEIVRKNVAEDGGENVFIELGCG